MPNWCSNDVTITGPKAKVKALWDRAVQYQSEDQAKGLLEAMAPIGDWQYGNAVQRWGTKWDVSLEGLEFEDDGEQGIIQGYADSAWAPPIDAFIEFVEANPEVYVECYYFEPGTSFVGFWNSEGVNDYYEIDPDNFDAVPEYLRDHFNIEEWYDVV